MTTKRTCHTLVVVGGPGGYPATIRAYLETPAMPFI